MKTTPMKNRILKIFHSATPLETLEGAAWYDNARAEIEALAIAYSLPARTIAGVVAVLSPRLRWSENIIDASNVIYQFRAGITAENCKSRTFLRSVNKAYNVLQGDDSAISGPKVTAFYRNLLGDPDVITIDIWVVRAAIGRTLRDSSGSGRVPNKTEHAAITRAYENAANELGIAPTTLQAIVWVAVRNRDRKSVV